MTEWNREFCILTNRAPSLTSTEFFKYNAARMNALLRYASPLVAAAALATSCGAATHSLLDPVEVVPVHADRRDATEVLFEPRQPRTPGTVEFSARFALHHSLGARFAMRVEDCPESFAFSINDVDLSHSPSDASLVDITPQMRVGMNDVVLTFRSYPHGAARPRGILFESRADFLPATVDPILQKSNCSVVESHVKSVAS